MASSSRKINRGVRVGKKTYASGMEDELAKVLPSTEAERLISRGYLEGEWTVLSVKAPPKEKKPVASVVDTAEGKE